MQYSRQQLDAGAVGSRSKFWIGVQQDFVDETKVEYNTLLVSSSYFDGIDCSAIIIHDAGKLHEMWKNLNARYKTCADNFTKSGTHDVEEDFVNFVHGQMDVLYLRHLLKNYRPGKLWIVYRFLYVKYVHAFVM